MSINNDIRVRQSRQGRFGFIIALFAVAALVLAFSLSFLPSYAKADLDPHYVECHNQINDNGTGGIDLKDSGCADVDNDIPELFDQNLITTADTATSTTLEVIDGDNDLVYFEIFNAPAHGTLSGILFNTAYTLETLPTVTYTPASGYTGTDSFDLKVNDGLAGEDDPIGQIATFSVTINAAVVEPVVCGENEISVENTCTPCGENQHVSENACVDNTPALLECGENQHVADNQCVDNEPAPQSNGGNSNNNNGGGVVLGGPNGLGYVNTNPTAPVGQVLGASTELPAGCSAYLSSYLKKGTSNAGEVKKLQTFLNAHMGLSLPVTGVFGPLTFDAVSAFQAKYSDEVLKPWFEKGLSKDMNPSGYAYKMTLYKINLLQCASLDTPVPQLP